jgi:hypothetical protein
MQFRTIVAAFFLDTAQARPMLEECVRAAGMTDVAPLGPGNRVALGFHDPGREVVGGQWGAFGIAWAVRDDVEGMVCLQVYASMNHYLDALPTAREREHQADDPLASFVAVFRDACLALQPIAAFLDTRAHYGDAKWEDKQGNRDWVLSQADMVAGSRVSDLADARYSVLYLGDALAQRWDADATYDDRDSVAMPRGRLVFAGRGPARMA